jgi:hypothetical protein
MENGKLVIKVSHVTDELELIHEEEATIDIPDDWEMIMEVSTMITGQRTVMNFMRDSVVTTAYPIISGPTFLEKPHESY